MSEDVSATFVVTYYRRLYAAPQGMRKFYNSFSLLTRVTSGVKRKLELSEGSDLDILPFLPHKTTAQVYAYNSQAFQDGVVVSVYGSLIQKNVERRFAQQFVLVQQSGRWFVIADSFFRFDCEKVTLLGCESASRGARAIVQPQQQKRSRAEDFDAERTVTIVNLSNNYKGDDVCRGFEKYGEITGRFYTYNTIYLEFESSAAADAAASPPFPMYQGSYTQVSKGIVPVQPKTSGRRVRRS